jgi:hypothetical protein
LTIPSLLPIKPISFLIKNKNDAETINIINKEKKLKTSQLKSKARSTSLKAQNLINHVGEGTRRQIIKLHDRSFGLEGKSSSLDLSSACAD